MLYKHLILLDSFNRLSAKQRPVADVTMLNESNCVHNVATFFPNTSLFSL